MSSSRVKEIKKGATRQESHLFTPLILSAWSRYVKKKPTEKKTQKKWQGNNLLFYFSLDGEVNR
jgi:hypothetical protein